MTGSPGTLSSFETNFRTLSHSDS